jgi:hypothetical protein
VGAVADERMADMLEVPTDLVAPPGLRLSQHQCVSGPRESRIDLKGPLVAMKHQEVSTGFAVWLTVPEGKCKDDGTSQAQGAEFSGPALPRCFSAAAQLKFPFQLNRLVVHGRQLHTRIPNCKSVMIFSWER